jgi:hypothetical protein
MMQTPVTWITGYLDLFVAFGMFMLLLYILVESFYRGKVRKFEELEDMDEVKNPTILLFICYSLKMFLTFFGNFYLFVYF